jgi:hypothetical protein
MEITRLLKPRAFFSGIAAMLLAVALFMLVVPSRAQAQTTFDVSATFADNNSTPLTGTVTINTATGAVDGFDFDIPTMTIGSTTLGGALFTPSTANESYLTHPGGSEIDFQLIGAPPEGDTLFLEIPQTTLVSYAGGPLLQEVTSDGTMLHTSYQSGARSNPFIEITEDGSITPAPEPSSLILFATSLLGLLGVALKKEKA